MADEIPPEAIKTDIETAVNMLYNLFSKDLGEGGGTGSVERRSIFQKRHWREKSFQKRPFCSYRQLNPNLWPK